MRDGRFYLESGSRPVNLFIHPGSNHVWTAVDWMLTNFHLPESTLIMMVGALIGDLDFTLHAYQEAIREGYRFYSYGDAMLISDR
jgi:S-adenosylmethionine:tRNA ribosyltransferase-isomerase